MSDQTQPLLTLIVEDDPKTAAMIERYFQKEQFATVSAFAWLTGILARSIATSAITESIHNQNLIVTKLA